MEMRGAWPVTLKFVARGGADKWEPKVRARLEFGCAS